MATSARAKQETTGGGLKLTFFLNLTLGRVHLNHALVSQGIRANSHAIGTFIDAYPEHIFSEANGVGTPAGCFQRVSHCDGSTVLIISLMHWTFIR